MNQKTLASAIAFTIGGAAVFSAPSAWAGFQPPVNAASIEVAKNDIAPLYHKGKEVYSKKDMMIIGDSIGTAYCQNESFFIGSIRAGMYANAVRTVQLSFNDTYGRGKKSFNASVAYSILKQTAAGKCKNPATVSGYSDWFSYWHRARVWYSDLEPYLQIGPYPRGKR